MHIGKDFHDVDAQRIRWTGHVAAVIKGGDEHVQLTGTAWFEEGDFSRDNPTPNPNPPGGVYVETDGVVVEVL